MNKDMDIFFYCLQLYIARADTSDFEEGEIRSMECEMTLTELEGSHEPIKMKVITPMVSDWGINKDKDRFMYTEEGWRALT